MDWDKLKTFHAAADAGSLTGAAELLHLSQSAVSRQISGLEDEVGVKLFHRHTRGLLLTEPGRVLFESTSEVAKTIIGAESKLLDIRDEPSGVLRVTAPTALGTLWLIPRLPDFEKAYPGIELRIFLVDHELDIANLEADVALRPWPAKQNDLIQRKLMSVDQHLYASQVYLDTYGEPDSFEQLCDHRLIAYGPRHLAPIPKLNWHLKAGLKDGEPPRKPIMEVNTIIGLRTVAEAGMGLCGLPDYVAASSHNLVRVMEDEAGATFENYLLYPVELKGSRRVAAFIEFVTDQVKKWKSRD